MGLIKEPLDIDFIVDSRLLTKEEELTISKFIKADKIEQKLKQKRIGKQLKIKSKQPA